jgi:hypothetical protein
MPIDLSNLFLVGTKTSWRDPAILAPGVMKYDR